MAFDSNLLFSSAQVVTTTADSTTSLNIKKTPAKGVPIEIAVTAQSGSGSPTLDAVVKESTDGVTYVNLVTFDQITTTGRWTRQVQTQKAYLKITYTIGGTTSPSFTVTSGIVSGAPFDQVS